MRNGKLAAIDIKWEGKGSGTSRQSLERTKKYYIEFTDPTSLDSNLELKTRSTIYWSGKEIKSVADKVDYIYFLQQWGSGNAYEKHSTVCWCVLGVRTGAPTMKNMDFCDSPQFVDICVDFN
jgi:hypothetical protein